MASRRGRAADSNRGTTARAVIGRIRHVQNVVRRPHDLLERRSIHRPTKARVVLKAIQTNRASAVDTILFQTRSSTFGKTKLAIPPSASTPPTASRTCPVTRCHFVIGMKPLVRLTCCASPAGRAGAALAFPSIRLCQSKPQPPIGLVRCHCSRAREWKDLVALCPPQRARESTRAS